MPAPGADYVNHDLDPHGPLLDAFAISVFVLGFAVRPSPSAVYAGGCLLTLPGRSGR